MFQMQGDKNSGYISTSEK